MEIILTGIITDIFPTETVGSNNFQKKVFFLKEEGDKYPNHWQLELQQTSVTLLDNYKPEDKVSCSININGRLWEKDGKRMCFNTLRCWKIVGDGSAQQPKRGDENPNNQAPVQQDFSNASDDLPF